MQRPTARHYAERERVSGMSPPYPPLRARGRSVRARAMEDTRKTWSSELTKIHANELTETEEARAGFTQVCTRYVIIFSLVFLWGS